MSDLWTEKYRPKTLDGYVFKNNTMNKQVREWLSNPTNKKIPIPNILLSGSPGVGKSTLAHIILNELKIPEQDRLILNGSRENSIDVLRNKIVNFISIWPAGNFRVVMIDEADHLSTQAQAAFRGEIERFSDSARFIFTLNYPHKIMPALHSRFQSLTFDSLDMEEFVVRLISILDNEDIKYDLSDIDSYVNKTYPDLRKCINLLDQNSFDGSLHALNEKDDATTKDYLVEAYKLFKTGNYTKARKLVVSQAQIEEYESVYRYFYQNLDMFGSDEIIQSEAVLKISKGLINHSLCADAEINLAATMIELSRISKK